MYLVRIVIVSVFSIISLCSLASKKSDDMYKRVISYSLRERYIEAYALIDSVISIEKDDVTIPQYFKDNTQLWKMFIAGQLGIQTKGERTYKYQPSDRDQLNNYKDLFNVGFSEVEFFNPSSKKIKSLLFQYKDKAINDKYISEDLKRKIVLEYVISSENSDFKSKEITFLINEVKSVTHSLSNSSDKSKHYNFLYDIFIYLLSTDREQTFSLFEFDEIIEIVHNEWFDRSYYNFGTELNMSAFLELIAVQYGESSSELLDLLRIFFLDALSSDSLSLSLGINKDVDTEMYADLITLYSSCLNDCVNKKQGEFSINDFMRIVYAYGILANYYSLVGNQTKSKEMVINCLNTARDTGYNNFSEILWSKSCALNFIDKDMSNDLLLKAYDNLEVGGSYSYSKIALSILNKFCTEEALNQNYTTAFKGVVKKSKYAYGNMTEGRLLARGLLDLSFIASKNGDYQEAIKYARLYVKTITSLEPENSKESLSALAFLCKKLIENEDFSEAREIYYKISNLCKQYSINPYSIGNFNKHELHEWISLGLNLDRMSIPELETCVGLVDEELGKYSSEHEDIIECLGRAYRDSGQYETAIQLLNALKDTKTIVYNNPLLKMFNVEVDTISLTCEIMEMNYRLKPSKINADKTIDDLKVLLSDNISKSESIQGSRNIKLILDYIKILALDVDDFDLVLWAISREQEIFKYDENSPNYFHNLETQITCNSNIDRIESHFEELQSDILHYIELYRGRLIASLSVMTDEERNAVWSKESTSFKNKILVPLTFTPSKEYVGAVYNALLLSKGVQLQTTRDIDNALSSNRRLRERYKSLLDLQKYVSEDQKSQFYIEEKKILKSIVDESPIGQFLSLNWKDIQAKLTEGQLAVEFFYKNAGVNKFYGAIILEYTGSPRYIKLDVDLSSPTLVFKTIWEPILLESPDTKLLLFSPDGDLNFTPIEYAYTDNKESLYDKGIYTYRLSSTREIVKSSREQNNSFIVLFGGLKYGETNKLTSSEETYLLSEVIDEQSRGEFSYLPGTLKEVIAIDSLINNSNTQYKPSLFTGEFGNKDRFTSYNLSSPNILHVATHGFYFTPKEVRRLRQGYDFLIPLGLDNDEDAIMSHSGILLAGATDGNNRLLKNGIVTSQEISKLNLSGTDFVVLSACQTGLGDLQGDGVFGLQRGFKKAGVNSMMLSLWKVDDEATQIFMTKFYEHFLQGESKHQSLIYAQNYLKNFSKTIIENGVESEIHPYSDPKYWSAFILLDANE